MERDRYTHIRLADSSVLSKIKEMRRTIVVNCKHCNGEGILYPDTDDDRIVTCKCMKKFSKLKDIIISGAPIEAYDVYEIVSDNNKHKRGRKKNKLIDVEYRRVKLSTDSHDIVEFTRGKKYLYENLLTPFVVNADVSIVNGDSIVLFGKNSRGKTWGLYYMLINLMSERSVFFTSMKDLFVIINTAYYGANGTKDSSDRKEYANSMLDLIKDVDLLLIDEGSKLPSFSDNVSVQLEGIIKERIGNRKSVAMATNHSPPEFYEKFGPQVVSALIKNVYSAHILNGPDLRHKCMKDMDSFPYLKGETI